MTQYLCVRPWKRHSVGEIIPEHEYNRLPHEIKQHGNFEAISEIIEVTNVTGFGEPLDDSSGFVEIPVTGIADQAMDIPATVDALKSLEQPKPHRYADKGTRPQRNSGNSEND